MEEEAIKLIKRKIDQYETEMNLQYMGDNYYEDLNIRISELNSLLEELQFLFYHDRNN